jgi:hypothetical protein
MPETTELNVNHCQARDRKLVFISHSSDDSNAGMRLAGQIEAIGIPCWIAPRDVPFGAHWGGAIVDAIETCKVFVILLSANANKSVHVENELVCAANYKKEIFPLRIENVKPSRNIELPIGPRHWVDLFEGPPRNEQNMHRFLVELRDILRAWIVPDLPPLKEVKPASAKQSTVSAGTAPASVAGKASAGTASDPAATITVEPASTTIGPPPPSPELRQVISSALRSYNHATNPIQSIAANLYRIHGPDLVPELCLMLGDQEFTGWKDQLFQLIGFCLAEPKARVHEQLVFATMLDKLREGGPTLSSALQVINKLRISRRERWERLFGAFPVVHLEYGYLLVLALIDTVPFDRGADLGRALAEVIHVPSQQLQLAVIDAIEKLGYRAAIPDLIELLESTADWKVAARASKCFADWQDADSARAMRSALVACTDAYSWLDLAESLSRVEGHGAADFLSTNFCSLANQNKENALGSRFWNGLKALSSKQLPGALRRIATSAADPKLQEMARQRLSELGGSDRDKRIISEHCAVLFPGSVPTR